MGSGPVRVVEIGEGDRIVQVVFVEQDPRTAHDFEGPLRSAGIGGEGERCACILILTDEGMAYVIRSLILFGIGRPRNPIRKSDEIFTLFMG